MENRSNIQLHNTDCMAAMKDMKDNEFDLAIVDPPYGIGFGEFNRTNKAEGKFCVENVISYYKPLIKPAQIDRHYFWTNFFISDFKVKRNFNIENARASTRNKDDQNLLSEYLNIKLPEKTKNQRLLLRNCVYPPLGIHILNESKRNIHGELFK